MGYVKREANSKMKITVENFKEHCINFLCNIKDILTMQEISLSLILNWDHTGLKYVRVDHGSQRIKKGPLAGVDDKQQITGVFVVTLGGDFLPPQLIYKGTTSTCLPKVTCSTCWHLTDSPNHWANEFTTKDYIQKIINPYLTKKHEELCLASNHHALCIF